MRVYPIRTSRTDWEIPLHCYHECSSSCNSKYVRDKSDLSVIRYIIVDNPEYINDKCPLSGKLTKTSVNISSFDIDNPYGNTGPLYEPDNIVIPDNNFSIRISYPLFNCVDVNVSNSNKFSLSMLLNIIKKIYEYIYKEEEQTSTPVSYHFKKDCEKCVYKDFIQNFIPKRDNECSICYNNYNKNEIASQLNCGHYYHTQCIFRWIETSTTCPLCRHSVIDCDECDGTGIVFYNHDYVVIPLEHRGEILNRNTTNGVYGIYGHDLDDLFIESMYYNRIDKILTIDIGS